MKNYDVIVIGAGNAGLSSAATLALEGKKVCVFEKHNIPGGCGTSFRRGRFEFEVALHQLSSMGTEAKPGPLRELFKEYGILDQIEWIEIESLYKVNLPGGLGVALQTTRKGSEEVLCKQFPQEKENILAYYDAVYKFCDEMDDFLAATAKSAGKGEPSNLKKLITQLAFAKKYPYLAKYALKTTDEVLNSFFESKELQLCLSAYWCFMGMPPERFPFYILAKCTTIYIEDKPFYLRGGSQMISQALTEAIIKAGGDVKFNCGVKEIVVKNNKAVGVIDANGEEYSSQKIISNISPTHTYANLVERELIPREARDYLAGYTVGISALTCFIGLDCPPEAIGFTDSFNLIYDDLDANETFKDAYNVLPEKDPIIATCYTVDDPKGSPEGTSIITAGTLKYADAWEELNPEEYYETKYKAANIIVDRLEKRFPGIRSHIEEIEVATPLTHMRYLNHPGGAIYGYEQDVKSTFVFFPRESFIENLHFASGWVNVCGFGPNYMFGNQVAKQVSKEVK